LVVLLLVIGIGSLWFSGAPRSQMTLIPSLEREKPGATRKFVDKYWWKGHDVFFSPRTPVRAMVTILKLGSTNAPSLPGEPGDAKLFVSTNGLKLWSLKTPELEDLAKRLTGQAGNEVVARPGVMTADGVEASVFTGYSVVVNGVAQEIGVSASLLPKVKNGSTDLALWTSSTEFLPGSDPNIPGIMVTNFAATIYARVPANGGLFLLSASSNKQSFGVVVTLKGQQ
jgi:hypothetical protein